MTQSASFLASGCRPRCLVVPTQASIQLLWAMLLDDESEDSLALLETLPSLHVFVEVPTLGRDRIAEPRIYWSTDPTRTETSRIPVGSFKVYVQWGLEIISAGWELWRSKCTFNVPTLFFDFFDFPTLFLPNFPFPALLSGFETVKKSVGKRSFLQHFY